MHDRRNRAVGEELSERRPVAHVGGDAAYLLIGDTREARDDRG